MILLAIIACEVGFWVAIIAGLVTRYVARKPRLGAALLVAAPVIDVVLLILVAADLIGGGTASWHHGLAALYIGISVAYGHRMIAWADRAFAVRFRGASPRPRLMGWAYTRKCWVDVLRTLVAAAVAAGIIVGLTLVVDAPARTAELQGFLPVLAVIVGIDLLWAVSYTLWPKKAPAAVRG
ncbi:hypothetical protein [Microbacterium imperiale]|uniref:Uncharacterized protein n=1 Tax=Microbacterium imperiale TaxID=33884 RepID=A0A9W6M2M7_9MICO|nr:hypothetical protein [Microbacterium imperiale]MBP2419543.1 exosortase/archaeosortase [Microbacterium imperiale]MDS0198590.1 hypothetical protein [Microbacterium imperiale]BFE39885.1 hypothetical protein GCM10017544_08410 [Microbacterium imperiale]GLJ79140.1 hypothetical protein GCM10017586_08220 [Microbacterium imperiale]